MSSQNHPTPSGQKFEPKRIEEPAPQEQPAQGQQSMPQMPPGVNPYMDVHPIYTERARLQGEVAGVLDQLEQMREDHAAAIKRFEEDSEMLEGVLKNARRTLRNIQININQMEEQARQAQQTPAQAPPQVPTDPTKA